MLFKNLKHVFKHMYQTATIEHNIKIETFTITHQANHQQKTNPIIKITQKKKNSKCSTLESTKWITHKKQGQNFELEQQQLQLTFREGERWHPHCCHYEAVLHQANAYGFGVWAPRWGGMTKASWHQQEGAVGFVNGGIGRTFNVGEGRIGAGEGIQYLERVYVCNACERKLSLKFKTQFLVFLFLSTYCCTF